MSFLNVSNKGVLAMGVMQNVDGTGFYRGCSLARVGVGHYEIDIGREIGTNPSTILPMVSVAEDNAGNPVLCNISFSSSVITVHSFTHDTLTPIDATFNFLVFAMPS